MYVRCCLVLCGVWMLVGPLMSQESQAEITLQGQTYTISGNHLTILIGDNPRVKVSREVPAKVRERIEQKYSARIRSLEKQRTEGMLTEKMLDDSLRSCRQQHQTAQAQARRLAEEFSRVDFSEQSYLYRLAYVIYQEGNLPGALDILNDRSLEKLEHQQAWNYILLAENHFALGELERAERLLERAIYKYPFYDTYVHYAKLLYDRKKLPSSVQYYLRALAVARRPADRFYGYARLGQVYESIQLEDSTRHFLLLALESADSLQSPDAFLLAGVLSDLGRLSAEGNQEKAISFYRRALEHCEELPEVPAKWQRQAVIHQSLAALLEAQGDHEQAAEHREKYRQLKKWSQ